MRRDACRGRAFAEPTEIGLAIDLTLKYYYGCCSHHATAFRLPNRMLVQQYHRTFFPHSYTDACIPAYDSAQAQLTKHHV